MAQRWRDENTRHSGGNFGGNQRPPYWDQNEGGRNEGGGRHRQGQDYRDRDRGFEQFDSGSQGSERQELSDRDYGGARFSRGMERDFDDMGPGDMGSNERGATDMGLNDMRGGSRSNADWPSRGSSGGGAQSGSGWQANQSAFYGEEGGHAGRDAPYSHGGQGHRTQWGQGGGQGGYEQRSGGQGNFEQRGGERHGGEQHGARWGQFGGHDEETQGPRSQRGMGRWREQYGSGEDYGHGGGPAGQMDYGHGYYGRDERGQESHRGLSHRGPSHRGKGPKGYERSPERLKEDLCERLSDAHDVDASEISLSVKDGIVTLEGTVPERQMKYRAEDLVERCPGVKDVENRLKVQGAAGQSRPSGQESSERGPGQQGTGQQGSSNQNRLTGGGSLHH